MAVSPFRQPGAQTFLPGNARPQAQVTLPEAGSPLMQQLVKFVQARNPAIVVNEGNVQANLPTGPLDRAPGTNFRIPGAGRDLLRQLLVAGLARPTRTLSPTDFVLSSPVQRENAVNQQRIRMQLGLRPVVPFVDQFAHMNMSGPSGGGVSAPQVPVNTLPARVPVATLPEPALPTPALPFAQTPVGPMMFPPGPQAPSYDPRRRLLFR